MVRRMLWTSIFALLLVSALSAPSAYGLATYDSVATIDWANLHIVHESGGSIIWGDLESYSWAEAESSLSSDYDNEDVPDWDYTDATAIVTRPSGQAVGNASTNDLLYESVSASSDSGDRYDAKAKASRYGEFSVSGAGVITIIAPYMLSLDLDASTPGDSAYGYSEAYFGLTNTSGARDWDDYFVWLEMGVMGNDAHSDSSSGWLSVSLRFNDGEEGDFSAYVYNEATVFSVPIPEPATMLLLGTGLIGFAGFRRKFKK